EMQRIIEEIYGEGSSSSAGSAAGAGAGAAGAGQRFFQQGAGQGQGGQGGRGQGQGGQGQGGQGQGGGQGGGVRRQGRNQEGDQEPPPGPGEEEEEEGEGEEEKPPGEGAGFIPPERNVRVTIDPRTNTLIVTGGEELDSIDQLIRRLDADPGQEQATLLVRLRNHDAEALEPILRELFEETTTGSTATAQGPAAPGVGGLAGEVRVRADTTTNSLLFVTSTRNFSLIENLVAELDVEPPQVLIKAYVIEVDLDDATEFGVEGSYADQLGDDLDDEFKTDFGVQALADQEGGFTYSLAKNNADALVRAIQRNGKLDVLSAPRILVQDNQEASINIGSEVPFVTNSRLTDQGTTLNTIEYRDIGIILSVTPHVNPDGLVRMLIAPEVSEVAPESQSVEITEGVLSPVFLTNTASTTITIQHGHTILMGGLIRDRLSDSETKIPLLGDIPILGYFFKTTTTEKRKVELMILVTPYVLFRARDLPVLTDFELDQLEFIDRRHIEKVAPRVPFEILDE
ncbi:MAG: hypothetical protein HY720_02930, partial [Planctomycetes bacterium]|nr:hypothetical protein [Planctomycetota bacterium]